MNDMKRRLRVLEVELAIEQERPVVLFSDADPARIEDVRRSDRVLILIDQSHGFEVWRSGERIAGEIRPG